MYLYRCCRFDEPPLRPRSKGGQLVDAVAYGSKKPSSFIHTTTDRSVAERYLKDSRDGGAWLCRIDRSCLGCDQIRDLSSHAGRCRWFPSYDKNNDSVRRAYAFAKKDSGVVLVGHVPARALHVLSARDPMVEAAVMHDIERGGHAITEQPRQPAGMSADLRQAARASGNGLDQLQNVGLQPPSTKGVARNASHCAPERVGRPYELHTSSAQAPWSPSGPGARRYHIDGGLSRCCGITPLELAFRAWGVLACLGLAVMGVLMFSLPFEHDVILSTTLTLSCIAHGAATFIMAAVSLAQNVYPLECIKSSCGCCRFMCGQGWFFGFFGLQALSILGTLQVVGGYIADDGNLTPIVLLAVVWQFVSCAICCSRSACSLYYAEDGIGSHWDIEMASDEEASGWCCHYIADARAACLHTLAMIAHLSLGFLGYFTAALAFQHPDNLPISLTLYFAAHGSVTIVIAIGSLAQIIYKMECVGLIFGFMNSLCGRGLLFVFFGLSELLSLGFFQSAVKGNEGADLVLMLAITATVILFLSGVVHLSMATLQYCYS